MLFAHGGYFAKEIFKIMLIHASMLRKFAKITLALNSYIFSVTFLSYQPF